MKIAKPYRFTPLLFGCLVGLIGMIFFTGLALAAPQDQTPQPTPQVPALSDQNCKECHLDIAETWGKSPHANAFIDPVFQERWNGLGKQKECLECHTTSFNANSGSYSAEGVSCEACHGKLTKDHPPAVAPIRADADYCGACHTTTLHEWRLTGHAQAGVGCMDCHDPHSQGGLFKVADDMCINCHKEDMGNYLEDTHIKKNIGCVDCHALVIPPDPLPQDGIVPTGHAFTISPATCVACHTDSLHAGFKLPGYSHWISETISGTLSVTATQSISSSILLEQAPSSELGLSADQRIQALETSLANRSLAILLQGGLIGLVLGGTTAWLVARNTRRSEDEDSEDEIDENTNKDA